MRITIEPEDEKYTGMPAGEYQLHPTSCNLSFEVDRMGHTGGRSVQVGPTRTWLELRALLHPKCLACGNVWAHSADCPVNQAEQLVFHAAAPCEECGGSGQWVNPVTGRASPCSKGCRP